ncbi:MULTISPECIES: flagellar hook capping FlgD N-terminal domain-containing protein [unclassified Clostridium]|uniref:flagellar hook capping FlgD N-terminal domain-containing protein n=1 Tax=unclassified Clostridium TaxID=2614128 RepID=UPI0002978993|nr:MULTISPECIES: flagellar hook capping FlgD N-terminal domain-containing protein [unclassified Clostridium]EKQ51085.1 MAG: flagellar hook capping protein [Clostridium sp. Maddingley MBC34-26]
MAIQVTDDVTKSATDRGTPIKKKSDSGVSKDGFLKILAAQLSNLDPTQNQDSSAYVAQMAQFASLEQMQNLNTTMSDSAYQQMVGKLVTINETTDDGKSYIQGYVTEVIKKSTGTFVKLNINGKTEEVDASKVIGVVQSTDSNTAANSRAALNSDFMAASALAAKNQNVVLAEVGDDGTTTLIKGKAVGAYIDTVNSPTVKIKVELLDDKGNSTGETKTYSYGDIVRAGDLTSDEMDVKLPSTSTSTTDTSSSTSSSGSTSSSSTSTSGTSVNTISDTTGSTSTNSTTA